jgi:type II secretory pathway pseudopilin PulG
MKFKLANRSRAAEWSAEQRLGAKRMRSTNAPSRCSALRAHRQAAFTLAEVLAALLFMAIVIPVAMQGLQIASRAGTVSERKAVGARLAERKLNELLVTGQWQSAAQKGTVQEGTQIYNWQLLSEPWSEDGVMRLLTVQVSVPVQGRDYEVQVSTLVDATQ